MDKCARKLIVLIVLMFGIVGMFYIHITNFSTATIFQHIASGFLILLLILATIGYVYINFLMKQ
jgi:hypothetical protein